MELVEQREIALSREDVWEAIIDPDVIRQCIAGCETVERVSETEFTLLIGTRVGPLHARFAGTIELTDLNPPESYILVGSGKGGVVGFASGAAKIRLQEQTEPGKSGTILNCRVEAKIGGRMAHIGARLVEVAARKMTADFLSRFINLVEK